MRLPRAVLVPRRGGLHPPALSPEPCSRSSGLRSCLPICIAPLATSRHRASLRRQAPRQRAYISSNKQVDVALESTCCKHLFRMFCLFILQVFHTYVVYVAMVVHVCCKCFIWTLCMVCNGFQVFFRYFYKCFRCMFHLYSDVYCKCCIWMFQK
jgi:hypothetical protein